MGKNHGNLTSAEIGSLWTDYMNDSMSKCILSYMLTHFKAPDIYFLIEKGFNTSVRHLEKLTEIFQHENFAIPNGFTENDVNINPPSLYSDTFCLTYINHTTKVGMLAYSGFIAMSAREDMMYYYSKTLMETVDLYHQTTKIAIVRAPYIPVPKKQCFAISG